MHGSIMKEEMWKTNTYVLLREGVDKLWEDLVGDNSLSQFVRVVGKSSKGKSGGLLDTWDVIEEEWSQEGHNT